MFFPPVCLSYAYLCRPSWRRERPGRQQQQTVAIKADRCALNLRWRTHPC